MHVPFLGLSLSLLLTAGLASAQPETMAWGNLLGLRVEGHLHEFETSLCVAQAAWSEVTCTGKEQQTNMYTRSGKTEIVTVEMREAHDPRPSRGTQWSPWVLSAKETIEDTGPGSARIRLQAGWMEAPDVAGAYLGLRLPASVFSGGTVKLDGAVAPALQNTSLTPGTAEQNEYLRATARGARFLSRTREIDITFDQPTEIIVRDNHRRDNYDLHVYFAVLSGKAAAGATASRTFDLKVIGDVDRNPIEVTLDATHPGRVFDGIGGNFRIQNPGTDLEVVDYVLDNLRLAWGRVEMPWNLWQPEEIGDSLTAARNGILNPRVRTAMELAQRLAKKGMPVIVSAWNPPAWAVTGPLNSAPQKDGTRGNPLNPGKLSVIRESIADYLMFLKEKFGVEAAMFSFNESDLGINIRQTPREHDEMIKALGATFASRGLATKLALGDTSDATPIDFIKPALHDPAAAKYIGAVDFHSWRGCTDTLLTEWRQAATELDAPLIVAEGSTDAGAYRYPQIFGEQSFAQNEINLYLRILAIAQPQSILQWQLTADYPVLAGGGILNDSGPLRPTRRFWNLKQLAATPPRSFALPVHCSKSNVTCAAFGEIAAGEYTVHIVNNGATRTATLNGLPESVKELRQFVTDGSRGMEEIARIPVIAGKAEFRLDATSFTTLMNQ